MAYEIVSAEYVGPFEGLYQQLNTEKLRLQSFALAALVEGFLAYLNERQDSILDLDEASGFLVMAAALLEIKARLLFPPAKPDPEPDAEAFDSDPEAHLAEYRRYQQIAQWLAGVGQDRQQFLSREPIEPADLGIQGPDPLAQVTMRDLVRAFDRIFVLADDDQEPLAPVYRDQWTVEEQVRWLAQQLTGAGATAFTAVFLPGSGRMMLIVTFLALLELIKLGAVAARQSGPDEEIMLVWLGRSD